MHSFGRKDAPLHPRFTHYNRPANPCVSCAAEISLQPLAFWPDHIGEKSALPCFSAAARNGASAAMASGNAGAAALSGPARASSD